MKDRTKIAVVKNKYTEVEIVYRKYFQLNYY